MEGALSKDPWTSAMPFRVSWIQRQRLASLRISLGNFTCAPCSSPSSRLGVSAVGSLRSTATPARLAHNRPLANDRAHAVSRSKDHHIRYATNLASRTAINPPSNVPTANQQLYASLDRLKDIASDYVNQSRLQLALRGLETSRPTVRVGLLGLGQDGDHAARKLARVLLADALGEQSNWETFLDQPSTDGKPLLLRYGAEDDIPPLNPLINEMNVPSRVLQKHNLEILITSLNTSTGFAAVADPAGLAEAILVPPLQTPVASTGRAGFVRYPVHKAIIVGEGIKGCVDFGRLSNVLDSTVLGQTGAQERLIQVALSVPRDSPRTQTQDTGIVSPVDISQAAAALELFRQDVANGPAFNAKWQASNIQSLIGFLTSDPIESSTEESAVVRPTLHRHIRSTLDSATAAIALSESSSRSSLGSITIPEQTRLNLSSAISGWAQHAHSDLQLSLANALASRSWRRTSWSRLLWRVDDVGVAAEEVLRSHWLLDAESGLAFLAGRIEQAGFFRTKNAQANFNPDYAMHKSDRLVDKTGNVIAGERAYLTDVPVAPRQKGIFNRFFSNKVRGPSPAELLQADKKVVQVKELGGIDILYSRPWPLAIHFTRQKLLHTLVPALQSRAQALLLASLTTIGATSALGVWIFVATGGVGVAEAGAVAALGLVWSLRRLQKKWEAERHTWEAEVRENGRVVLAEVEDVLRRVVRENERPALRPEDVDNWQKARAAIQAVEEALQETK